MARTFDGVDDQVAFGSEAAIDNMAAYTAVALVRITGNVTNERVIFTKFTSGFVGKQHLGAQGDGTTNNQLFTYVSGGTHTKAVSVANALVVNTWRVVVATWPGQGAAAKLYVCDIGGVLTETAYASTTIGSAAPDSEATATLRLAARDAADATFFSGGLAECALWNRVLSAGELTALGRGYTADHFPSGLVAYSEINGRYSPELNTRGTNGTVTGTTYLDHPSMIPVSPHYAVSYHAVAAGGGGLVHRALMLGVGI